MVRGARCGHSTDVFCFRIGLISLSVCVLRGRSMSTCSADRLSCSGCRGARCGSSADASYIRSYSSAPLGYWERACSIALWFVL